MKRSRTDSLTKVTIMDGIKWHRYTRVGRLEVAGLAVNSMDDDGKRGQRGQRAQIDKT